MAQVSYRKNYTYNKGTKPVYKVGFFPTLQDGEEIFVRFPYSKGEEFHTVTTHTLKVNGIFRHISCPEENCPLCAKEKAKETIFVKVLIYKTEGEVVTPTAVVWARPKLFGKEIEDAWSAAFEYNIAPEGSPLEDIVFKIKRTGTGKSTKYSVKPAKAMYQTSELYGKKFDDFKDLRINGVFYLEKSGEDITYFLTNGSFPSKYNNVAVSEAKPVETKLESESVSTSTPLTEQKPVETPVETPVQTSVQSTSVQPVIEDRPRRKYNFGR